MDLEGFMVLLMVITATFGMLLVVTGTITAIYIMIKYFVLGGI